MQCLGSDALEDGFEVLPGRLGTAGHDRGTLESALLATGNTFGNNKQGKGDEEKK